MFNNENNRVFGAPTDVYSKCKISGTITTASGTGNQSIMAHSWFDAYLLGASGWYPESKTYELFLEPNWPDEGIMVTRRDDEGNYFAEIHDRISLYTETFTHGEEFNNIYSSGLSHIQMFANIPYFYTNSGIINENLQTDSGYFVFYNNLKDCSFVKDNQKIPLPKKVRGTVQNIANIKEFTEEGIEHLKYEFIEYFGEEYFRLSSTDIPLNKDPFGDGSQIYAYPLRINGKHIDEEYDTKYLPYQRFYYGGFYFIDPTTELFVPLEVDILIDRSKSHTIVFNYATANATAVNAHHELILIPNMCQLTVYANKLYYYNMNGSSFAATASTFVFKQSNVYSTRYYQIAVVLNPSGFDYVYIDGYLVITRAVGIPNTFITGLAPLLITNRELSTSVSSLNTIREVRVFNRALSEQELNKLSNDTNPQIYFPTTKKAYPELNGLNINSTAITLAGNTLEKELVVHIPLKNGNIGNILNKDVSSYSTFGGITMYGDCIKFDGSSGYLWRGKAKGIQYTTTAEPWRNQYDFNTSQSLDITGWTAGTSLPATKSRAAVLVTKNRVYLIGGRTSSAVSTVYTAPINADGTLGSWTTSTSLPGVLSDSTIIATKSRVYLMGGWTSAAVATVYTAPINTDGTLGSWTTSTSLPGVLSSSAGVVTENRIYLLGGRTSAAVSTVYTAPINADGTLGTWTLDPPIPAAIELSSVVKTKNRVYLIGGWTTAALDTVYTAPIEENGTLGAWTLGPKLPVALYGISAITTNSKVYIFGGISTSSVSTVYMASIDEHGFISSWESGTNLPGVLHYSSIITTNSRVYLLGGYTTASVSTVYTAPFIGGYNDYRDLDISYTPADINVVDESNIDIYIRFKPVALTSQCLWKSGNEFNGIAIGIDATAHVSVYSRVVGVLTYSSFTSTCTANNWYKVVIKNTDMFLYADDDTLIETLTHGLSFVNATGQESIGAAAEGSPITGAQNDSGFFNGFISDIVIADKNTIGKKVVDPEYSLLFTDNIDNVELHTEIINWDIENDKVICWINIPKISSDEDTTIRIKYGTSRKSGLIGTEKGQKLWKNNFLGVYHLNNIAKLKDSTANNFDGTFYNIDATNFHNIDDKEYVSLDGVDEYSILNINPIKNRQRLSISMYFSGTALLENESLIEAASNTIDGDEKQVTIKVNNSSQLEATLFDNTNSEIGSITSNTLNNGDWYFSTINYNGRTSASGINLILNGSLVAESSSTGYRIANNESNLYIGKDAYSTNNFSGYISEIFITEKQIDPDFNKAMYLSMTDSLGTYSFDDDDLIFTVASGTLSSSQYNVPIKLFLGSSSGITSTDVTGIFNNIKVNKTKYIGDNALEYALGSLKDGSCGFNMNTLLVGRDAYNERRSALYFDGYSIIDLTNTLDKLFLRGSFTITFWIKPVQEFTSTAIPIFGTAANLSSEFIIKVLNYYTRVSFGGTDSVWNPGIIHINEWNFVTIARDISNKRLYYHVNNNSTRQYTTYSPAVTVTTQPVYLGGYSTTKFTGFISDIKIYGRVFTEKENYTLRSNIITSYYKDNIVTAIIPFGENILKGDTLDSVQIYNKTFNVKDDRLYKNGAPWVQQYEFNHINESLINTWVLHETSLPEIFSTGIVTTFLYKNYIYAIFDLHVYRAEIDSSGLIGTFNELIVPTPTKDRSVDKNINQNTFVNHGGMNCTTVINNYAYVTGSVYDINNTFYSALARIELSDTGTIVNYTICFTHEDSGSRPNLFVVKNRLYRCCGYNNYNIISFFIHDDGTLDEATQETSQNTEYTPVVAIISDYLYVIGGYNSMGTTTRYTIDDNGRLTNRTSIAQGFGLSHFASCGVVTKNYIYVFGGTPTGTINPQNQSYRIPINADKSLGTPVSMGALLVDKIAYSSCCVIGNYIYLLGGYTATSVSTTNIYRANFQVGMPTNYDDSYFYNVVAYNKENKSDIFYSLSLDNKTYSIVKNNQKVNIVTKDPLVHGNIQELDSIFYYDPDTDDWVYSDHQDLSYTISKALEFTQNKMSENALLDISSIFDTSIGSLSIATSFYSDGTETPELYDITINNKKYWISEEYKLSDYCAIITEAKVHIETVITKEYRDNIKIYCMLNGESYWTECTSNNEIPNLPAGTNTTDKIARFRVVWDLMENWSNIITDVSLEVIIK